MCLGNTANADHPWYERRPFLTQKSPRASGPRPNQFRYLYVKTTPHLGGELIHA
jgi:hypothetical protein